MSALRSLALPLAGAALLASATLAGAAEIRSGTLTCDLAPSAGFLVGSHANAMCHYRAFNGLRQDYNGSFNKLGLDIGVTTGGRIIWAVFEPAIRPGGLAGTYRGAQASATVAAGVGANVLVGGNEGGVTLQPVSVQGQTGLSVAAGYGSLTLDPASAPVEVAPVRRHHRPARR